MRYCSFIYYIFFLIFVLFGGNGYSQFRKYSNEFLNIGAGARALGMGSSQIASVGDGTAGYWNPAGLMNTQYNPNLALMHAEYFGGIGKFDFAGIAIPTNDENKNFGVSILRFAVDDIPNTLFLVNPDGSVDYNNISTFSSADMALLLSYAQTKQLQHGELHMGGSVKIIRRTVGSFANAWGFGIDLGVQYQKDDWRFAAVLRDATSTYNIWRFTFTDREKEALYLTNNDIPVRSSELTAPRLIVGAGKHFNISDKIGLYAEANLNLTFDGKRNTVFSFNPISIDPNIGLEASFNESFFLRAGISNFQRALADGDTLNQKKVWIFQPSLGAGFKMGNTYVDYAFSNLANQSNPLFTHVFSLKFDLIKKEK